jgi:hypothetical protein
MGWQWKKKYGVDVIQIVCKAIGRDSPSIIASRGQSASLPTSSPHNALSSLVSTSFGLNCIDRFIGLVVVYSRTATAAGTQCSTGYNQRR